MVDHRRDIRSPCGAAYAPRRVGQIRLSGVRAAAADIANAIIVASRAGFPFLVTHLSALAAGSQEGAAWTGDAGGRTGPAA